jgi:hypothetical protein
MLWLIKRWLALLALAQERGDLAAQIILEGHIAAARARS